jgi:tetratricopeptide (TPR) repeat protein
MTHASSLSRRCALTALVATFFLAAQQRTNWEAHFQEGVRAFEAGRYAQSIESLTAALQDAAAFPALDLRRADAAHLLGMSYQFRGDFDRAQIFYLQAKAIRESTGEAGRKFLGITLDGMAQLRFEQERWKDAEELDRQAVATCNETRGEYDECTLTANRHLAEIYSVEGRLAEGESILQKVIQAARRDATLGPQLLPVALRDQALIVIAKGQYNQAEPLLKEALDLSGKLGQDRSETADNLVALARLYRVEGDSARAEPLLNQAAAIYEKNADSCLAHALQELGMIAITDGKYAIARQRLLRAIDTYRRFLGADHINAAIAEVGLAEAYLGERNYTEAESAIEPALVKETAVLSDAHPELARAHMIAARISERLRHGPDAAAHYRQALDIYRRITPRDNPVRVLAERQYERFTKSFRK